MAEIFAFIVTDEDGTEGIPAVKMGFLLYPLVTHNEERIPALRAMLTGEPLLDGKKVVLAKFSQREDIQVEHT